tara:strand:- start:651 stop:881 length:231 start_codon:yes stop_codon:yes gene_type:complete
LGVILVSKSSYLKSVGVSTDTYEKIVEISRKERRSLKEQVGLIIDDAYEKQGFASKKFLENHPISASGGLSAVIED